MRGRPEWSRPVNLRQLALCLGGRKLIWPKNLASRNLLSARLESVDGELGGREHTAEKLRAAIKAAGIEFIDEDGGGLGVRLRKRSKEKSRN